MKANETKVNSRPKVETLEEYLARGGSIKQIEAAPLEPLIEVIRTTTQGAPAILLSLEEADLFFGEPSKNKKPKKVKALPKIDLDVLPPALRAKFIAKLKEDVDGEEFEEEIENTEEVNSEDGEEVDHDHETEDF